MIPLHKFFSASILFSLLTFVIAGPTYPRPYGKDEASDLEAFQRLLDQVDPPSLHAALHDFSPKKFKHGMFPEDRTAVEVIHRDDPPLATSIASLAKRQGPNISNGTATSAPTTTTQGSGPIVTPVPLGPSTSSTGSGSSSPNTATTDTGSASGSPSSATSSPDSGASTSTTAGSLTSASASPSLTAGALLTTTNAAGATVVSTLSSGSVVTTVDAAGVTIVSTVGGGSRTMSGSGSSSSAAGASTSKGLQSSHTSLVVQTTTLPNGQKSTVTAVTMVTAGGDTGATPSGTAGVSGSGTASSSPGLQTAMAARTGGMKVEILCVVGGAVGMAMLM